MTTGQKKRRSQALEFASTVLTGLGDAVDDASAAESASTVDASAVAGATPARAPLASNGAVARGTPERYDVVGTLGEGGMGRVLEATDLWFGRRVAVKEILVESAPVALIHRFLLEALVTGNLEHPGIVAVYERGVRDGRPYYVMRKLPGRTIADALDESRGLRARLQLVPMLVRVAETIAFAHEHGVIHRDLKPENVVLGTHGEVTVIDWGIARIRELDRLGLESKEVPWLAEMASQSHTVAGSVLGTPAYMAPEQAEGLSDKIDERTDVFALGALLYHVLSGRAPFDGPTLAAQLVKSTSVDHPPILALEPKAPARLVAICTRAMSKDPEARFASADEMAIALQGALTDALTAGESRYVRALAAGVSAVSIASCVVATIATWSLVPTFREMGNGAYPVLICAVLGGLLGLAELLTKDRYRLSPLTLAFAGITFLAGIVSTLTGALATLRAALRPETMSDAAQWRSVVTEGSYESIGGAVTGAGLAAIVLVLWILARLRTLTRPHRSAAPAGQ